MMNAWWKYGLMAALLTLVACTREEEAPLSYDSREVEGQKVKVEFSFAGTEPSTKGLDNGGDINSMYVAVFGSSHFLKEYEEATLKSTGEITYQTEGGVSHTVPFYTYTVELTITDSPRIVHFLGNGPSSLPFGYDTAVMPVQMSQLNDSQQGEKAYWQMIDMPDGIQAQRDSQGYFIDTDGDRYLDADGNVNPDFDGFILAEQQKPLFQNIPLIRNWAKIVLYADEDSNFTPKSFAVINFPSRGAIAPYSGKTGFIRDYQDLDHRALQDMGYTANLPAGTEFDTGKPAVEAFQATSFEDGGRVAAATTKEVVDAGGDIHGNAVYLYERPVPSDKIPPTYVIVYGYYDNEEDQAHKGNYFYKVDLMETSWNATSGEWESSYYPIYRNFKYQIRITKILSMGHATPEAAAASAGSADVSADITTGHISDISDGVGRLQLTWMNRTYQEEHGPTHPVEDLQAYFGTIDGNPITDAGAVTAKVLPASDGGPDIIYNAEVGAPSQGSDPGWRPIRFCTAAPGKTIRSQTLRITGNHSEGRLYRDVVITVLPTQEMRVECLYPVLNAVKGASQAVSISIPEGLTKNVFPIEFQIEPQDLTLTPDTSVPGNNLPVVMGESISDDDGYRGKQSYHFTRTLTWDDYRDDEKSVPNQTADDKMWRTFTCYFKSNCALNATRIWVSSSFFEKTSTGFTNYGFGQIHDALIPVPVPRESEVAIPFTFQIEPDQDGVFPEMTLRLTCLVNGNESGSGVIRGEDMDTYLFTPTQPANTLTFITTTSDGDFALELSAPGYNTVTLAPYRFNKGITTQSFGLLDGVFNPIVGTPNFWSNVAYGRVQSTNDRNNSTDRGLLFGYYDDPDAVGAAQVTLTDLDGTTVSSSPSSYPYTPTGPQDANGNPYYHEIMLKTVSAKKEKDVYLVLSAPGYVTETYHYERLTGKTHIHTGHFTTGTVNNDGTFTIKPTSNSTDKCSFVLTVTPLDAAPVPVYVSNNLYLGRDSGGNTVPGSRYEIKVVSGDVGVSGMENNRKNQRFFCGFFQIDPGYEPVSWEPATGSGTCFRYPGSGKVFEWLAYDSKGEYVIRYDAFTPETNPVKTMVVEVGDSNPIRISRFTYKGISNVQ